MLVAVVVGPSAALPHSELYAGAWNWILKDGVGQLGGVLVWGGGLRPQLDRYPKFYRCAAAILLDAAATLELLTVTLLAPTHPTTVLAVACFSNIWKNLAFLALGASKAALHPYLCQTEPSNSSNKDPAATSTTTTTTSNLGDITAKATAQAMMAGLLGTSLGMAISKFGVPLLCLAPQTGLTLAFVGCSAVHQICTYQSLRYIPIPQFHTLQRLEHVLDHLVERGKGEPEFLTPQQIAEQYHQKEVFSLAISNQQRQLNNQWLKIGSSIEEMGGPGVVWKHLEEGNDESRRYVLVQTNAPEQSFHLTFFEDATSHDLLQGMWEAYLRKHPHMWEGGTRVPLEHFRAAGWSTAPGTVRIEPADACRIRVTANPS